MLHKKDPTTFETSDHHPSSPVCEEVKIAQITLEELKSKQLPCTVAVDKYTWKTCTIDEQMIACLKTMSQNKSSHVSTNDVLFWTNFLNMMTFVYLTIFIEDDYELRNLMNPLNMILFCGSFSLFSFILCAVVLTVNWIHSCCVKTNKTNVITADDLVKKHFGRTLLRQHNLSLIELLPSTSETVEDNQSSTKFSLL